MKAEALKEELVVLKGKNSWGTNRQKRGLTEGYSRFDYNYNEAARIKFSR